MSPDGANRGTALARFLIVDDQPAIHQVLTDILKVRGIDEADIRSERDGENALEAFQEHDPDLVFLDINMEGVQGDDVAQVLLQEDPRALIVGITGLPPGHEQVVRMVSCGVYDVIHKPLRLRDIENLFNLVREERSGLGRVM